MAQYQLPTINPAVDTGVTLSNALNSWRPAVHTNHAGSARPSYAVSGMIWVQDTVAGEATIYYFDGAQDIMLFKIDTTTGQIVGGGGGSGSGAVSFKGSIDPTVTAPTAIAGDFYISNTAGLADSSFSGIAGQSIGITDLLIYDGTFWSSFPNTVDLTGYLPLSGGTLTGPIYLSRDPIDPMEPATRQWVESLGTGSSLPLSGGTLTGPLYLNANPTDPNEAANKAYVDARDALKLNLTGGTLTGPLLLSGAPTASNQAATKNYVDNWHDPSKLNIAGGTLTGELILAGDATNPLNPVTYQQLQDNLVSVIVSTGSPDAGKLVETNALGKIDNSLISISTGFRYGGQIDPTGPAPAHQNGIYYILYADGVFSASFGPPLAGTTGSTGDIIISDGTTWELSPVTQSGTSYVDKDLVNSLGTGFQLVADGSAPQVLIDGTNADNVSLSRLTIAGGTVAAPNNKISLLYTDTSGLAPTAAQIAGGGLSINRADKQLYGLDSSNTVSPLIGIRFFSAVSNYTAGDLVTANDRIYQAMESITGGVLDLTQWRDITPGVGEYSSGSVYQLNDIVSYAGNLYRCLADDTGPETFTPANWQVIDATGISPFEITNGTSSVAIPSADGDIIATVGGNQKLQITSTGFLVTGKATTSQTLASNFTLNNELVSKLYVDTGLATKAALSHSHTVSDISNFTTSVNALVTFETLTANGDVGTGASQLAIGNHTHAYLPLTGGTLTGNLVIDRLGSGVGNEAYVKAINDNGGAALVYDDGNRAALYTTDSAGNLADIIVGGSIANRAAYLYFESTTKLNTNSTGIYITGKATSSQTTAAAFTDNAELVSKLYVDTVAGGKVSAVTSTDNAITRFNGTAGQIQNSSATVDDSGYINCTTPPAASNTTQVATTAWVRTYSSGFSSWNPLTKTTMELGGNLTGDRNSLIDFHADDTNTDFSARIIRLPGVNGALNIENVGTGLTNIKSSTGLLLTGQYFGVLGGTTSNTWSSVYNANGGAGTVINSVAGMYWGQFSSANAWEGYAIFGARGGGVTIASAPNIPKVTVNSDGLECFGPIRGKVTASNRGNVSESSLATDEGMLINLTYASGTPTYTIIDSQFDVGAVINFRGWTYPGIITIDSGTVGAATGLTAKPRATNSIMSVVKVNTGVWIAFGDLATA